MKVNNPENNVMSYEINGNHFEQYGRRKQLGDYRNTVWRKWLKPGRKSNSSS